MASVVAPLSSQACYLGLLPRADTAADHRGTRPANIDQRVCVQGDGVGQRVSSITRALRFSSSSPSFIANCSVTWVVKILLLSRESASQTALVPHVQLDGVHVHSVVSRLQAYPMLRRSKLVSDPDAQLSIRKDLQARWNLVLQAIFDRGGPDQN